MGEPASLPPMPSKEEWERCCQDAEQAVRKALHRLGLRRALKAPRSDHTLLMLAAGAIVASADLLRVIVDDGGNRRVAEEMAVSYVRGVIRGLDHPVHEDGSAYEGARLDG